MSYKTCFTLHKTSLKKLLRTIQFLTVDDCNKKQNKLYSYLCNTWEEVEARSKVPKNYYYFMYKFSDLV